MPVARALLAWCERKADHTWWGRGQKSGSFIPVIPQGGKEYYPFAVWSYGSIEIQFQTLRTRPAFSDEAKRQELCDRLNKIPGINIPVDRIRRPSIKLTALSDPQRLQQFLSVLNWVVGEICVESAK